ncbi:hypothetical protein AB0G73_13520 [Streptomyces sp. NPDC020719]|uniref:hypothetical protein n=1 Tax=unclassified Streptomyces TaxID=2593676 RepID=UPI003404F1F1
MNEPRDAETATGTVVHVYTPCEVVAINLRVDGRGYRAVVMAHYDRQDGRRAYRLCLWPAEVLTGLPEGTPGVSATPGSRYSFVERVDHATGRRRQEVPTGTPSAAAGEHHGNVFGAAEGRLGQGASA